MIGGPVRSRAVEGVDLIRRLELGVVVEHIRLVGVDVPVGLTRDLPDERWARKRVVQVPRLAVEDVRVGSRAFIRGDEVGHSTVRESRDRIFECVRVHVADQHEIGIAAPRRIRRDPRQKGGGGGRPRLAAVALTITRVGIVHAVAVRALGLQMVDDEGDLLAGSVVLESLRERGPVERIDETWIDRGRDQLVRADRSDR